MSKTRNEYVALAKSQVGVTSGDKYRKWYNNTVGNIGNGKWAYCAAGLAWTANQTGLTSSEFPYTASAPTMLKWFKNNGRFHARGTYKPLPGDTVIFKWSDNYTSSASHVGTVTGVSNGYVSTVEYNSDYGNVCAKLWSLSNSSIVGYGVPYFTDSNKESEGNVMNFKKGNKGDGVLAYKSLLIQAQLLGLITTKVDETNSFGNGTNKATLEVQKKYKLEQDGIAGVKTITALRNAVNNKIKVAMQGHNNIIDDLSKKLLDLKV